MRKNHRFAFLAIGALGLMAAVAPGLAATLTVPTAASAPAAGQGVVTVQGFTVTDINWTIDATTERVHVVTFDIARQAAGAAVVTAVADGSTGNAVVRVRLEHGSNVSDYAEWQGCVVSAGVATCTLAPGSPAATDASAAAPGKDGARLYAASLDRVNIIAFDRN
jgi:hypothetical protein